VSIAEAISRALGGRKTGQQWMVRCVAHADRTPSLALRDGDRGRLLVHCHAGCHAFDVFAELRKLNLGAKDLSGRDDDKAGSHHRAKPTADRSAVELALQIFTDAVDPRRGPVQVYLQGRGLGRLPDDVIDVRYHPRCPRGTDRLPAMIALMRDAVSNEPTGVHRTFLRSDGSGKADVSPAKMMLGRAAGSVVKLTPDEDVLAGLGLSEGLEDGIAILNMGWRPVWACMSAVGMSHFPVLRGIEALTLFRDADRAGLSAAGSCAGRWRRAGLSAVVVDPRNWKDFAAMAEALCHE
jgi:putative DNA primase/helicase